MFAPRNARGQKAVASSTNAAALRPSTLAARRFADRDVEQARLLPGRIRNQATLERELQPAAGDGSAHRFVHDFSRIRIHAPASDRVRAEKAVDGNPETRIGMIMEKDGPDAGTPPVAPVAPPVAPPVKVKKAGVDSFTVDWSKNAASSATTPSFRLDYKVKFTKDADHDPAVAEFRQNAMTTYEVTAGPNKGSKGGTAPLHNDNYSRADDTGGHALTDVDFVCNDNPSVGPFDKDDVLTYSFTAEQMIIDTADANKVVAKRGPHTATASGKDPRAFAGVPKKLS